MASSASERELQHEAEVCHSFDQPTRHAQL